MHISLLYILFVILNYMYKLIWRFLWKFCHIYRLPFCFYFIIGATHKTYTNKVCVRQNLVRRDVYKMALPVGWLRTKLNVWIGSKNIELQSDKSSKLFKTFRLISLPYTKHGRSSCYRDLHYIHMFILHTYCLIESVLDKAPIIFHGFL